MYSAERQQEILKWLEQHNRVSVAELAAHFGVSPSSIRRDLGKLQRLGIIQRTYGGAISLTKNSHEAPFSERVVAQREEKERIGRAAARLIEPEDTIFVDGGTTTQCMLAYLPTDFHITIVTAGLNIVQRLVERENVTVVLIGGTLHVPSLTFSGVFANESFECFNIHFDKAFLAASGVSAEAGLTNAGFEELPIKRRAVRRSRQNILLADSTKVGVTAAAVIAPIEQLHRLITTAEADPAEIERIRRRGVIVEFA